MKRLSFSILLFLCAHFLMAQSNILPGKDPRTSYPYLAEKAPFFHGVASGDPLADRVIIWTRVSPESHQDVEVSYFIADDPEAKNIIQKGVFKTNEARDFTVKVDVIGLKANTPYYYYFEALGGRSEIGRTMTAPSEMVDLLRFAVVSCSNYQQGYFNAYRQIARRKDLNAVIHLGDYIYEMGAPGYGYTDSVGRVHLPKYEIVDLFDYRTRYNSYRLDPDLQEIHRQHPFICIWDDHESTNDSYKDGALNHNEGEGDWETRKSVAKQAYFEWLPIRDTDDNNRIYRTLSYGALADLIMIDSRLEGREKQIRDAEHPDLNDPDRSILGTQQLNWLKNELKTSKAKWKILGNQVLFSPIYAGHVNKDLQNAFMDTWNGYPAERHKLSSFLKHENIDNVVIITGDFHTSFALDVPFGDRNYTGSGQLEYEGKGVAVEFATPSITSANFDEVFVSNGMAANLQQAAFAVNLAANALFTTNYPDSQEKANPHLKFMNLIDHGYFILSLDQEKAQADYFFINTFFRVDDSERHAASWFTKANENALRKAESMISGKEIMLAPAPQYLADYKLNAMIFSVWQESELQAKVHFSLKHKGRFSLWWIMEDGSEEMAISDRPSEKGDHTMQVPLNGQKWTGKWRWNLD